MERYELRRISIARATIVPLFRGRALAEIARPEARRFLPLERFIDHSEKMDPQEIDQKIGQFDPEKAKAALKVLGLDETAVDHLAFVLSQEKTGPLEALRQIKLNRDRSLEQSLMRRAEARRSNRPPPPIEDADFEPAVGTGGAIQLREERQE